MACRCCSSGSQLAGANGLQESLRLRGFEVRCATSAAAAIDAFRTRSFELVLAETRLDRGDGIELVPALRALPGILDLPVVLFDERPSDHRRDGARSAGASGYLSGPLDAAAPRLGAGAAGGRTPPAALRAFRTRALGLVARLRDTGRHHRDRARRLSACAARVRHLRADASRCTCRSPAGRCASKPNVIYRLGELTPGPSAGDGLRFCGFDDGDEAAWIEYLAQLEQRSRADI